MKHKLNIRPAFTLKIFLGIITVLFILHSMYLSTMFFYGYSYRGLFKFFNFNNEGNIPTLYAVLAIFFAAFLLCVVGLIKKTQKVKDANYWLILSAIFTFLAYDEAAQLHENFNGSVRPLLPESSYDFLYWAWVVPYAALTLIFFASFIKFLLRLPRRTALLFVLSGTIFVIGAVGLELFNSYFWLNEGQESLGLHIAFTFEELLEMIGIALFIYSILDYVKNNMGEEFVYALYNKPFEADIKSNPNKSTYIEENEKVNKRFDSKETIFLKNVK